MPPAADCPRLTGFSWKPIWRVRGSFLQDSFRIIEREIDSLQNLVNVPKFEDLGLTLDLKATIRKRVAADQAYQAAMSAPVPFVPHFLKDVYKKLKGTSKEPQKRQEEIGEPDYPALTRTLIKRFKNLQIDLAKKCADVLGFLSKQWAEEAVPQKESRARKKANPASGTEYMAETQEDKAKDDLPLATLLAEQFVCLVYVNFILSVLMRMRTLVMTAVGMFIFLLLSIGSYPFEPKQVMYSLLILVFLLIVAFVAVVYAQMHRDSTLSRITDSTPGELGLEFWMRLAGFTALPLFSLLLAQYPVVNSFLFSWLEPMLQGWK